VGQLQAGLDRSEKLILVATPEALASPRVADEWRSFVAGRRDWQLGRLQIVHLASVPMPPFLEQIQCLDFRNAEEMSYRRQLRKLVAGLLGHTDGRHLPALPPDVEIPSPPAGRLPESLRSRLVEWLTPVLAKKTLRLSVALTLGLKPEKLEGQDSWACAASAALVWATGQEEPVTAALRILDTLRQALDEDEPERVAALVPLRKDLEDLRADSPHRSLLTLWLQGVAKDHERLAPLQEQMDLGLLDRVYVQLQVRSETRSAAAAEAPPLPPSLTLPGLLALDRAERPWVTGRWMVLGDPGAGKTTLLRHLAATLARREDRPWVPLFDSLPRLLRDGTFLLDRIVRRLERAGQPAQGLAESLDRTGRDGRLLLLLDGLDEVPREDREDAEQLLRDLAVRWPTTPFVVTSRPIGYRPPGSDFREVEVLPLDREHRRELLARSFGRATGSLDFSRADAAMQALDAAELQEVAGNPLYLTLMALLFEQNISPDRNRANLYDQVFDLLLEGKYRPGTKPMERKEIVRAVLRQLACGMTEDNRDAEPVGTLEDRLYRPELDRLRADLERTGRWRGQLRIFLTDLAERTGILGPHDGPDVGWRFWHRTFREALTAEHLSEQYQGKEGKAAVLARARAITKEEDLSRWAEPFSLLAGRVQNPDDLVKALVQENRSLGLRALATAQCLREETVQEVLALTAKWQERVEVYRRLPELVPEPRRAMSLIDQLRRRTRNGNDLYFLAAAARQIGHQFPEYGCEVETLLGRLFDHIPKPSEELFLWIETPLDGRVPLWRDIPGGTFWMGSPEGEGHTDEHPHHEVTITAPFRCGAVPVTNAQYVAFDPDHKTFAWKDIPTEELLHHPVVMVTWFEVISFCRWLSSVFSWAHGARLPFEEEWEHACRAGSRSRYWNGDGEEDLAEVAWYYLNALERTHRVGEKPANPLGLYDVHGNVLEWTLSLSTDSYEGRGDGISGDLEAIGISTDEGGFEGRRVMRGGGCWDGASTARAAYRGFRVPSVVGEDQDFRVVLPAVPELSAVDRCGTAS